MNFFRRRKSVEDQFCGDIRGKSPAPIAPVTVPLKPPECEPACILYVGEVALLVKSIAEIVKGPINSRSIALIYDTLNHSAVVPPAPWPQIPHKFDSLISIPSTDDAGVHRYVPAFVFYPVK